MVAKFKKHRVTYTIGTTPYNFYFLAPPDHYTGIEADAGITPVDSAANDAAMPICKLEDLLQSPVMVRRTVRYLVGTKTKYAKVAIAASKSGTFDGEAVEKSYKGGKIKAVVEPLDATFY